MYKAIEVADYIIEKGEVKNLTPLKLQKMLYFIYGMFWRDTHKKLFAEPFHAWKLGPVVKPVYRQFQDYHSGSIPVEAATTIKPLASMPDDDKALLDNLIAQYGKVSAAELVTLSHLTEPWLEAYKDVLDDVISEHTLHRFFEKL